MSSQTPPGTANALTVDVEGFAESNRQSFEIAPEYMNEAAETREVERNMQVLLDLLSEVGLRATFYFVGTVAERLPSVVRETASRGHEIGSHNFVHTRLFDLEPEAFRKGLAASKAMLEDLAGVTVRGFRAPDFSITRATTWALDTLLDLGFTYDSSIYPTGIHDVYGIEDSSPEIHTHDNGLVEYPLSTVAVAGRRIPFGGGGYFRLYPVRMTETLIRRQNAGGQPCMFYIHPYEVGPAIPRISGLSAYRRFRHYYHCSNGAPRLRRLLERVPFGPAVDVLTERGYVPA
jgi:polysaccharide deacetylase family protein (PEP-CTERM system associated)